MRQETVSIPKEWQSAKLGSIADFKNGLNFTKTQKGEKGIPTVDVLNMYGKGIMLELQNLYRVNVKLENVTDYILKKGDILFVRSSLKREGAAWTSLFDGHNEPVAFCGFIIRARLNQNKISPEFLTYFLRSSSARQDLVARSGTVAITNINQDTLAKVDVLIPPLSEQRKIAEILSFVDTRIDIAERERQIIERLKVGIMKKLLDNTEWKTVSLGNEEHFEMIMGQSPPSESYNKEKSGLPFLQGNADFGPINPTPRIYCSSPIKIAKKCDVLISVRAPVGEVNIATEDYCIGRGLGAIRSKKEVSHEFLFYCLLNSKQQLDSISGGSTFKAVTKNQLEKFRIPLPPIHEQKKIAEILSTLDERLSLQRLQKSRLETVKKGLMNDLLTGKKRVEA